MTYLLVVFIVGLLIFAHELGHLLVGLKCGIPISRFSIGFGPRVWGFKRKGVEYRVSALPLGGYVLPEIKDLEAYFRIPAVKRVLFAVGGPLFNFLLPVPLFVGFNLIVGGLSFRGVFIDPFIQTAELILQVLASIPQLFTHTSAIAGPVGVVAQGGKYVALSGGKAFYFAAFLSVNFAIFNLLPVPILDGGKILFSLLEKIVPRSTRFYMPATIASVVLLLFVFAYATVSDISKVIP
ncbi:MAG: site-2 protease family protein [Planctomycetota bacterium]|jgi:regulator of sigma E protease